MILIAFRIGLCFLPDSPRWLVMRGRHTEARHLLARLADAPVDSEEVDTELTNIKDALEAQSKDGPFKMKELLYNGPSQNLRRTLLGVAAQFFQQISGINLIVRISLHTSSEKRLTQVPPRPTMRLTFSRTRLVSGQTCLVSCPLAMVPNTSWPVWSPFH